MFFLKIAARAFDPLSISATNASAPILAGITWGQTVRKSRKTLILLAWAEGFFWVIYYLRYLLSATLRRTLGYLPFFVFLAGASGFLGGLPFPGTLRIRSMVPTGYKASLVIGLIFCVWSLFSVAAMEIPNALDISVKVSPTMVFISASIAVSLNIRKFRYLLYKKRVKL
jgi:hypothetical protein